MDGFDVERFEAWEDLRFDLPELGDDEGGGIAPPPEPPERGRGSGDSGVPRRRDEGLPNGVVLAIVVVFLGTSALQALALVMSAGTGVFLTTVFSVLLLAAFLVPWMIGALWFGRRRTPGEPARPPR